MESFERTVWDYYRQYGRHDLPWRCTEADGRFDPYKLLVSELMLQQTQVSRAVPKFESFLQQFPTIHALAQAPLADVLTAWNGLGYNRRAKFLWQAAGIIVRDHNGQLPQTTQELVALPGIGVNTAGALVAYAYNRPVVFVETNIRTVFIYHFFAERDGVHDKDIADLVASTLPEQVREWYWALMDYGTHLKQTIGNLNTLSKHYSKQSVFEGSKRQIRGQVVRLLMAKQHTLDELREIINDVRLSGILEDLQHDGLVHVDGPNYKLGSS